MPEAPPLQGKTPSPGRKPFLAGVATGTAITALLALGIGLGLHDSESDKHPKAAASATKKAAKEATEATDDAKDADEETEDVYNPAPTPDDFSMKLKTKSKQCFGTAGCTVTVVPELSYESLLPLDPADTVSLTYEIRGGESGVITETLDVTDADQYEKNPTVLTTPGSGTKVTVKITDVEAY